MTPDAMIADCDRAMELVGPDASVVYRLRGKWGRATHKRLFGRSGPLGKIVGEEAAGTCICMFKAAEVKSAVQAAMQREASRAE